MATAYEAMLKNLYLIEQARLQQAMTANASHSLYAAGSSNPVLFPDYRQLAFEAMGNQMPSAMVNTAANEPKDIIGLHPTGIGKKFVDIITRPMQAVESAFKANAVEMKKNPPKNPLEEFLRATLGPEMALPEAWKGLSGQEKTSGADIIKTINPGASNLARGIGGFGVDIALDPISYINPVGAVVGAKNIIQGTAKVPLGLAAAKAAQEAPVGASELDKALATAQGVSNREAYAPISTPAPEAPVLPQTPTFNLPEIPQIPDILKTPATSVATKAISEATPTLTPEAIQAGVASKQMENILKTTPSAAGRLEAPAPFKETMIPVEQKTVNPKVGTLRAIKAAILQDPEYKIGGRPVAEIIKDSNAEAIINQHVKDLYASKDFANVPKSITFSSRTGRPNAARLTIPQAAELMAKGEVPQLKAYSEATDALTHAYPIHDVGDLEGITLKNIRGESVTLGHYLEELGLPITRIGPEGYPLVKKFDINAPAPSKSAKAVYERSKVVKLADKELEDWSAQHLGTLSKKEQDYLRNARTREEFTSRLAELNAKRVTVGFKNIDDFVAAAKSGFIPKEAVDKMLQITGAKTVDELATKVREIIKKTGQTVKAPTIAEAAGEGKFTRVKGPSPDVRFDAGELIDKASTGDTAAIKATKSLVEVTPQIIEDLSKALPESIVKNLITPQLKARYPYVTKFKGTLRTHKTPGVGQGRNLHGWNTFSQGDLFKSLAVSASKRHFVPKNLDPAARRMAFRRRPQLMYDSVMSALHIAEQGLKEQGVKLVAGTDNSGLLLSLGDVLDSIPENVVKNYLFNMGGRSANIYPTAFLDAAASLVEGKLGKVSLDAARENAVNIIKNSGNMANKEATAADVVRIVEEHLPQIMQKVSANYAEQSIKIGTSVRSMTDEVVHNIITKYANPNIPPGDVFGDLVTRHADLVTAGARIGAPEEANAVAKGVADLQLSNVVDPGDLAEANLAKTMEAASKLSEAAVTGVKQQKSRISEAMAVATDEDLVSLTDIFDSHLQAGLYRANVPILEKGQGILRMLGEAFQPHYGHADLHDMVWVEKNTTQSMMRSHSALMQKAFNEAHTVYGDQANEIIRQTFKHLQDPVNFPLTEKIDQGLIDTMKASLDLMFGASEGNHGGYAIRNGIFTSHLNEVMKRFGIAPKYRFEENVPLLQQANGWKNWTDVEDPLDVLDKMYASYQKATVDVVVGRDFSSKFGRASKAPGYVRVVDPRGKSSIFPFVDANLYYPKEIVDQLPALDKFMTGLMPGKNPRLLKWYDSLLHMWKSGQTIYYPSHHIRNLVGDLTLAYLQGVKDPRVFAKGMRVMAGRSKAYQGFDGLKALQEGVGLKSTSEGGTIFTKINGKHVGLGDDAVYRAAYKAGLLPDFRVLEDISFNEMQNFGMGRLRKPFGGRVQRFAGGVSMSRDHWVRISHFIDVLQKGDFKTLDEAFEAAGKTVRKWHPDGSDLTKFERSVMRRMIPFYSWMRKAIPLVVESSIMHPGKVVAIPKAFYAFAVANGVDPESLTNPFPSDQLFPSFLTNNLIGPQWKGGLLGIPGTGGDYPNRYHGANPGDPVTDILSNALGAQPNNFLAGSLTPAVRVPIELQEGRTLATQSDIRDMSDYWDQQIPGLGVLSNILNKSISGGLQPQEDVTRNIQQPGIDTMALLNRLTGAGMKDYSKPNYINRAVIERRNNASR